MDKCTCPNLQIGNEKLELYTISDSCLEHGVGTEYYERKLEEHRQRMREIRDEMREREAK